MVISNTTSYAIFSVADQIPAWPQLAISARERVDRSSRSSYFHYVGGQVGPYAIIQVTTGGCGAYRLNGIEEAWHPIGVGSALLFETTQHFRVEYCIHPDADHWEFLWFRLLGSAARLMVGGLVEATGHVAPLSANHPTIRRLANLIPDHGDRERVVDAMESYRMTSDLLTACVTYGRQRDRNGDLVQKATVLLSERWQSPPSIAWLAKSLGVSREHLARTFHHRLGVSPLEWLRIHRIHRIADLLLTDERPIQIIAQESGFASASHFIAGFRQVMGEPPSIYRERRRTGENRV